MATSSANSSSSEAGSEAAIEPAVASDAPPPAEEHVDGRKLRAERTRAAVIEALLDLLREDGGEPPLEKIAERAHVSPRSIFVHFHDREGLFTAAADRQTALTMEMMSPVDLSAPLAQRIDEFIDQRVRINDFIDPIRRAATRWENRSPVVSERLQAMRKLSRAEVEHVFEPELNKLDGEEKRLVTNALVVACSWTTWDGLRRQDCLSYEESASTMHFMIERILKARKR